MLLIIDHSIITSAFTINILKKIRLDLHIQSELRVESDPLIFVKILVGQNQKRKLKKDKIERFKNGLNLSIKVDFINLSNKTCIKLVIF